MKDQRVKVGWATVLGFVLLAIYGAPMIGVQAERGPVPKVIKLVDPAKDYLQLLAGPPETFSMRSGRVILTPGRSIGKHSTEDNEEVLVILEGQGEMQTEGSGKLLLNTGVIAYCPPRKAHDVLNTGSGPLRYIFVVAKAQK